MEGERKEEREREGGGEREEGCSDSFLNQHPTSILVHRKGIYRFAARIIARR